MTESQNSISVVVPVYRSERILPTTYERLTAVLEALPGFTHDIVFVNDGSPDDALRVLRTLAEKDDRVKVVSLSRNFGHQIAITAGLDVAAGDVVVIIDDDLQDPPEVIAGMVEKWREGYRVVYGVRSERKGESAFKLWTASAFYRMLRRLSDTPLPLDSGDFRLMDRAVVTALRSMREESRYMRGMVSWVGFSQCALPYSRDARFEGDSGYTLGKMLKLALDGIFSFSSRPLAVSTQFGGFVTFVSFALGIALIIQRLFFAESIDVPGWTSVILAVLFMGGVQLMSIGVLGAYIGRVFYETKRRPLYFVAEAINTPAPDPSVHER